MFSERGTSLRKVYLPQGSRERPSSSYQMSNNGAETSFYAVMDIDREVSRRCVFSSPEPKAHR